MINVFTIASQDQSVFYLGQVFGNIAGVLPASNGPVAVGLMFKVLNTAALSVGALIVVYTTVMGLLSTASEGEFLGKKWNGLWVPARTVLGIIGLFPSSGGYCAIQVIIMWLILKGVGLADTVWTSMLTLMEKSGGSPYVSVPFPNIKTLIELKMQNLFKGLVCYESLAFVPPSGDDTKFYNYSCINDPKNPRCGSSIPVFDPASDKSYSLGDCGSLAVCDKTKACEKDAQSMKCLLCDAEHQALPEIISTFDTIAKQFVQFDYQYQKFYYFSTKANMNQTPQWIQDFCTETQGIGSKCCVNSDSDLGKSPGAKLLFSDPACSYLIFTTALPPYTKKQSGKADDSGSATESTVKRLYYKYGMEPYLDKADFIAIAANQYIGVLTGAYTDHIATGIGSKLTGWREESRNTGWLLAGMYYYQMTKGAVSQLTVSMDDLPKLEYQNLPATGFMGSFSGIADVRNNISAAATLLHVIAQGGFTNAFVDTSAPGFEAVSSTSDMHSMVSSFMADVTGSNESSAFGGGTQRVVGQQATNPLYRISIYGYNLIWSVQLLFWVTVAISAVLAAVASIDFTAAGTGLTTEPVYEAFKTVAGFVTPFWMLGLSALFTLGVLLGIYIPFIPYTIYLMGVIGWLMATIEAMVAGPIIALGILSPSGQHEILGKAEPAVMIIFNLILRPSLMVFGLVTSLFLSVAVVTMINQSFLKVASDIITSPGLIESILMMMMYALILMMVLNKVFSLIHVIPEKVLTYIGGQAISYGESEGLAGIKQAMEGGAGAISGAAKEAGGGVAGGIMKTKESMKQEEAKDQQQGAGARPGAAPRGPAGGGGGGPPAPPAPPPV